MPKRRKLVTMEELFTREELERARAIFDEYKGEPRYVGELKVSDEVVRPRLNEITRYTGYDNGLLQHKLYSNESSSNWAL
jgi:hypothetical protein